MKKMLDPGSDPKGPMKPMGEVCHDGVGSKPTAMPDPDSLPRSGRYGRTLETSDISEAPEQGLPGFPPRSGYFGKR